MTERLLFLTGHLAEPRLRRLLEAMGETPFAWDIVDIGVQVAALMTEAIILRRLPRPVQATRIIFPGRAGIDPARLTGAFGVPFERGPEEGIDYSHWRLDRAYMLVPAQAYVGQWLQSFAQFPPRQKPASFNLDDVMKKLASGAANMDD